MKFNGFVIFCLSFVIFCTRMDSQPTMEMVKTRARGCYQEIISQGKGYVKKLFEAFEKGKEMVSSKVTEMMYKVRKADNIVESLDVVKKEEELDLTSEEIVKLVEEFQKELADKFANSNDNGNWNGSDNAEAEKKQDL